MGDADLTIASTTDTEEQIKAALAPREDPTPALSETDRKTGEPVAEPAAAAEEETPAVEEPAAPPADEKAKEKAAAPAGEKAPPPKKKVSRSEERINELTRD